MGDDYKDLTEAQRRQALATERTLVGLVTLAFVLAVGGIIPLGGLPGLAIFAFFHPLLLLLPYSDVWCHLHPDTIWPLAFFIAFLWPFSIPIGYAIAFKGYTMLPKSSQTLLWLGIMALWGLLLSSGLCIYGTNMSACMQWPGQPPPPCAASKVGQAKAVKAPTPNSPVHPTAATPRFWVNTRGDGWAAVGDRQAVSRQVFNSTIDKGKTNG